METKAAAAQIAIVSSLANRVKYLKVVQADRKAKRIRSNKARRARRRRKKEEVGCWVCGLRHLLVSSHHGMLNVEGGCSERELGGHLQSCWTNID